MKNTKNIKSAVFTIFSVRLYLMDKDSTHTSNVNSSLADICECLWTFEKNMNIRGVSLGHSQTFTSDIHLSPKEN